MGLFRQCAAVSVACHWAWAGLGRSKILEGKLAEAASHIQQASKAPDLQKGWLAGRLSLGCPSLHAVAW